MRFNAFFVVLSAASALGAPFKRDLATVKADIATIATQVNALDTAARSITTTNIAGALTLHTSAVALGDTMKKASTDIEATSAFSKANGQVILASVEAFEPTLLRALEDIVRKKATIAAIPITGVSALVLQDLKNLNTDAQAFATALISKTPSSLRTRVNKIATTIFSAFATAIAAYS